MGNGVAVCETEYGTVGLAVCFDIHTILAKYAEQPDQPAGQHRPLWALLYPIGWVGDTEEWFGKQLPEKLRRCNCPHYIFGANWATVAPPSWRGAGGSTIWAPQGKIVARAKSENGWQEDIVFAQVPTHAALEEAGHADAPKLDIVEYSKWSSSQIGTAYWTAGPEAQYSYASDLRRLKESTMTNAHKDGQTQLHRATKPWRRLGSASNGNNK
eukprot:SAG31_NODE_3848_length_3818_cov_14.439634_3_plen_213_part_00